MRANALFSLLMASFLFSPALRAQSVDQRLQLWHGAAVQGTINGPFQYWLEAQPRADLVEPRLTALLLRPAVGVAPIEQVSFWVGFAWIPSWTELSPASITRGEERMFEQVLLKESFGRVSLLSRTRLEHRLLPGQTLFAHRLRSMLRAALTVSEQPNLALAIWDEPFFHLNDLPDVQRVGFDQNRAFVGLSWKPTPSLVVEGGYLNVLQQRQDGSFVVTHAVATSTIWSFF